ncbi:hypothetical protein HJC99_02790 [Candidatus Saccharibacteria bacterium]|nr:hypothetical protein [Candidatus Saccharibacteria bacterium]
MDFKMLRRFWKVLGTDPKTRQQLDELKPIVHRTALLLVASEILALGEVYPIKMLIDLLSAPKDHQFVGGLTGTRYFAFILVVATLLYFIENIVTALMDVSRNSAAWKLYIIINGHGHRKQFSLGADWHVANSSGKKESLLSKNHKKVDT